MQYWELVTRSFRIAWNHKYLWLIALFSGESGGGFSFSYSQSQNYRPNLAAVQHQVSTWVNDHLALITALAIAWLVLAIALFIVAAVCEGATVRASAEHDAERPFGLAWAWRAGVGTMWVIVRFRLIIAALVLPVLIVVVGLAVGFAVSIVSGNAGSVLLLVLATFLFVLAAIPYGVYVSFLDRFGSRTIVLEQVGAKVGLSRANRLLFKRPGRSLLVWLLSIAVSFALSVALGCVLVLVFLPLIIIAVAVSSAQGSFNLWPLVLLLIPLVPIALVVQGFLAAQSSTYWTLAFRRMDLDLVPQYSYPYQPSPPPPAPQSPPQVTS